MRKVNREEEEEEEEVLVMEDEEEEVLVTGRDMVKPSWSFGRGGRLLVHIM